MDKKISAIDIFRLAASVMVIAIHTFPLADLSETADFVITHVLCRVAVPFFFTVSGAFLISPYAESCKRLISFVKKTVLLYVLAMVIYIPVNVYSGYFETDRLLPQVLQDIFFDGTMYHLWYLPASVVGACIAWFLVRKLGFGKALVCGGILYLFGLLGDSYYGVTYITPILKIYDALFQIFDNTRNGIFFAPIFFILGGYAAEKHGNLKKDVLLFAMLTCFLIGEGLLLKQFGNQRHDSMYILLAPAAFFLIRVLYAMKGKRKKEFSKLASVIYIIHPLVIIAVRFAAEILKLEELFVENNLMHFIAVTVCSAAIGVIITKFIPAKDNNKTMRAWREIDLDALRHNAKELKGLCTEDCALMAVVKADAYGHGAYCVSTCLEKMGIKAFAVATIDEGIALRKFGIRGDILVLGYTSPERAKELRRYKITQTAVSTEHAKALNERNIKISVHIKIDTGMHRLGIAADDFDGIMSLFNMKNLNITGIYSHLCTADEPNEDGVLFTKGQIRAFEKVCAKISNSDIKTHIQSSYGMLNYPAVGYSYVRTGIALYGVSSSLGDEVRQKVCLKPVMKLKTVVTQVKTVPAGETVGYGRRYKAENDTVIATLAIGYADGVPRRFSGNAVIHGKEVPIVGRVCMDQMTVDVSGIADVKAGDVVTVIGDGVSAEILAHNTDTITNEIFTGIGHRVETVVI